MAGSVAFISGFAMFGATVVLGAGTGVSTFLRNMGSSLGVSLLGAVHTRRSTGSPGDRQDLPANPVTTARSAGKSHAGLSPRSCRPAP
ncbi:hypothetical protein [Nonomuraea sp. NPDC050691]|uniref:hypothetical protein n=1 Tax=Nonomuraea sp. NPDC050691 TaxID=3155661 RepID=UPI00340656FB